MTENCIFCRICANSANFGGFSEFGETAFFHSGMYPAARIIWVHREIYKQMGEENEQKPIHIGIGDLRSPG